MSDDLFLIILHKAFKCRFPVCLYETRNGESTLLTDCFDERSDRYHGCGRGCRSGGCLDTSYQVIHRRRREFDGDGDSPSGTRVSVHHHCAGHEHRQASEAQQINLTVYLCFQALAVWTERLTGRGILYFMRKA